MKICAASIFRFLLVVSLASSAYAFALKERSLDEKVRRSTLVFIGIVEQVEPLDASGREFVVVRVERILKGEAPETIRLATKSGSPETNAYCIAGRRYLFFLFKPKDFYASVNGRFGIVPVDGKPDDYPRLPAEYAEP